MVGNGDSGFFSIDEYGTAYKHNGAHLDLNRMFVDDLLKMADAFPPSSRVSDKDADHISISAYQVPGSSLCKTIYRDQCTEPKYSTLYNHISSISRSLKELR